MIAIKNSLVSEDIISRQFVCDLSKCKGACCVEGDAGAPVEEAEVHILEEIYDEVKPYLRKEGVEAIEKQGAFVVGDDGEYETPLVNGHECAYVVFDESGTTLCGIEKAYNEGKIDFKKPVSCHLYPIRITSYKEYDAVNYHKWQICSDACSLGEQLKVPVYKFVKDGLVRKYGQGWYDELDLVYKNLKMN